MIPPLLAIFCWPVLAAYFFRRLDLATALILTIVVAYLALPNGVSLDLPVLPELSKTNVASLSALVLSLMAVAKLKQSRRSQSIPGVLNGLLPKHPLFLGLVLMLLVGAFVTPLLNRDPVLYGIVRIPGLRPYDAFSQVMVVTLGILPFLLARKFLGHPDAQKRLLICLAICGGVYMLPALFEIRMSPQLSNWIYDVQVRSWSQQKRYGGFRPVVFLEHSLWLGILMATLTITAFAAWRAGLGKNPFLYLLLGCALTMTVLLGKTIGAFALVVLVVPVVLFLPVRLQMLAAAVISVVVASYPILRSAGLVPVDRVVAMVKSYDSERAGSLAFRFQNEDILLDKALERPVMGWAGWGRSRVYDEQGRDISVTDGRWVIQFGTSGYIGYIATFGLITLPALALAFRVRRYELDYVTSGLCLALAVNLLDLLPNSGMSPVTWLIAGALLGRLETQRVNASDSVPIADRQRGPGSRRAIPRPLDPVSQPVPVALEGRTASAYTRFAHRKERSRR